MPASRLTLTASAAVAVACAAPTHSERQAGRSEIPEALARFKARSGGERWDHVSGIAQSGTIALGGLSGSIEIAQDALTGRSVSRFALGPGTGAQGFDGKVRWQQDFGGEVATLDAPEALAEARTTAWLTAFGYWYPQRGAATWSAMEDRSDAGRRFRVIVATPAGGHAVELWLEDATDLLARTVTREGADTVTTALDDYRDVDGVKLPFHFVVNRTDAAGRTDPRRRVEIRIARASIDAAVSEAQFAPPAMTERARIVGSAGMARVPFTLDNNHIHVDGTIDGKPVHLLVDTGGANVLTPEAAKRLGLKSEGKLAASGVGDQRVDLAFAHAASVRVGEAELVRPVFYIIDFGMLAAIEGRPVDGLVGFEMFRRFRVSIDYARRELLLATPAAFAAPTDAHVVPFEMAGRIPIIAATLDGVPVRLSVDTGSRSFLSLHSPFVRAHDSIARYRAGAEQVIGWGVGGPSRGRRVRFGTLSIGDLSLRDVPGDLFTGDKGAFANPDLAGNLGSGVLRKFTVTFDYDAKKMYLAPNGEYGKHDAVDRSGLMLALDGDALQVVALAEDGPGQRAGLAVGDRLTRISGEPTSARTLAAWRERFAELPAGTKLSLGVSGKRDVALVLADPIPQHSPVQ